MPSIILRNIRKRVRHKFMTHPLFVGIIQIFVCDNLFHLPSINSSRLRREVAAYLINLSAICSIFPGITHILYLLQGFFSRTITFEFEDVDIVLGFNHTIYPTFALLFFDEDRETADHSQYEIEGVLKITLLLSLIILATLTIRNTGKKRMSSDSPTDGNRPSTSHLQPE